ncbi:MAG TPA: hypothetical protein VJ691_07860 [Vicinamibacterales bacterium]|nr:hypothetical protein [Vicinamibacterales bacterium]
MTDELWFERLAAATIGGEERAPAQLKSRIYSALVQQMTTTAPLLDLQESKRAGGELCVFESCLSPLGHEIRSKNPCRVCHARVMGERMEWAPVFWAGCPYSDFHNG